MIKSIITLFIFSLIIISCDKELLYDSLTYEKMVTFRNRGLAYLEEENYTEASKDFLDFHNKNNDLREEEAANNLVTAENQLKELINYFTYFLQNNLTSVLAPDILANIDLARDTLSSKEINKLNK